MIDIQKDFARAVFLIYDWLHVEPSDDAAMNLREYFLETKKAKRRELAEAVGTSDDYLYLCSMGKRKPGTALCIRLVAAEPRFTLAELRPDVWGDGVDAAAASDDVQPPAGSVRKTKESRQVL